MAEPAPKRALGRGLKSLLDEIGDDLAAEKTAATSRNKLGVDKIDANDAQPRKSFDDAQLEELADSIRAKGVIQPILVRASRKDDGRYEIVAGERRWRAAQRAGLHEIPVVIRDMDDAEALEVAIVENVQRSDLNAIEEALGYRQLIDKYNYTQETLARNVGKSRSHIANVMRLMNLPQRVQEMVRAGELSAGHARALLSSSDPEGLALRAIEKSLSVRDLESAAKESSKRGGSSIAKPAAEKDADTVNLEGELSAALRMPVSIKHKGRTGGELTITYRTLDDLEDVCSRLRTEASNLLARA